MNNYNEVKKSFGTQAEKFASYHMSKAEYTDYLIRSIQAKGNEHALEVAAGTCICGRAVAPYVKDITCLEFDRSNVGAGEKNWQSKKVFRTYHLYRGMRNAYLLKMKHLTL